VLQPLLNETQRKIAQGKGEQNGKGKHKQRLLRGGKLDNHVVRRRAELCQDILGILVTDFLFHVFYTAVLMKEQYVLNWR
jgi:hypothetical protein